MNPNQQPSPDTNPPINVGQRRRSWFMRRHGLLWGVGIRFGVPLLAVAAIASSAVRGYEELLDDYPNAPATQTLEVNARGTYGEIKEGLLLEERTVFSQIDTQATGISVVEVSTSESNAAKFIGDILHIDTSGAEKFLKKIYTGYDNPLYTVPGSNEQRRASTMTNLLMFSTAKQDITIFKDAVTAQMRRENNIPEHLKGIDQKVITVEVDGEDLIKVVTLQENSANPYKSIVDKDADAIFQALLDTPMEWENWKNVKLFKDAPTLNGSTMSKTVAIEIIAKSASKAAKLKENLGCLVQATKPDSNGNIPAFIIDEQSKEKVLMTLEEAVILAIKRQRVREYNANTTGPNISIEDVDVIIRGKLTVDTADAIAKSMPTDDSIKEAQAFFMANNIQIKFGKPSTTVPTKCIIPNKPAESVDEALFTLSKSVDAIPKDGIVKVGA